MSDSRACDTISDHVPQFHSYADELALEAVRGEYKASAYLVTRDIKELTDNERYILMKALSEPNRFVSLPYVIRYYKQLKKLGNLSDEAKARRIYRAADFLVNRGLITLKTMDDGLKWVTALPDRILPLLRPTPTDQFDLIKDICKIPSEGIPEGFRANGPCCPLTNARLVPPKPGLFDIPRNAKGERLAAVQYLKGAGHKEELIEQDTKYIQSLFERYDDYVTQRIIMMLHKQTGEIIGSEYSTRFNDFTKGKKNLDKYDYAIEASLKKYRRAVFLTLTTDPKLFNCNFDANRHFGKAWNKFIQYVTTRRKGKRAEYIASYEFTKSGMLHAHIIIFVDYLMEKELITKEWSRVGQGEINWVYALKNVPVGKGREWRWPSRTHRPNDAKGMSGGDYLKKYMKKCLLSMTDDYEKPSEIQSMYWAVNKRFWSCSRKLLPPKEEKPFDVSDEAAESMFVFLGLCSDEQADRVDRMIYTRGKPYDAERVAAHRRMTEGVRQ